MHRCISNKNSTYFLTADLVRQCDLGFRLLLLKLWWTVSSIGLLRELVRNAVLGPTQTCGQNFHFNQMPRGYTLKFEKCCFRDII